MPVDLDDLPEQPYWEWFAAGVSAEEAAEMVLESCDFPFDDDFGFDEFADLDF